MSEKVRLDRRSLRPYLGGKSILAKHGVEGRFKACVVVGDSLDMNPTTLHPHMRYRGILKFLKF